ncbi:MAG: hypothetical protein ACFE8N_05465 [Promethearchaeota archaeon]
MSISIIPHTWQNTNLKFKKPNDKVNIEIDILAKYVENLLSRNDNTSEKCFPIRSSIVKTESKSVIVELQSTIIPNSSINQIAYGELLNK